MNRFTVFLGISALATILGACMIDSQTGMMGGTGTEAPATGVAQVPMQVELDSDRTMEVDPGQGVGVFVQYQSGGHWVISWTCDSLRTGESCLTNISVEAESVSNVRATRSSTEVLSGATKIAASSLTTMAEDGIAFDGKPGQGITVKATVAGIENASLFFFVQDGKVNGGYAGALSNPLTFRPTAP